MMCVDCHSFGGHVASGQNLFSVCQDSAMNCELRETKYKLDLALQTVVDEKGLDTKRKIDLDYDNKLFNAIPPAKRLCTKDYPFISKPAGKKKKIIRFKDENIVHSIPPKTETWPYGSIFGGSRGPVVPKVFRDIYSSVDVLSAVEAAFSDMKSSVGRCFLLYNGAVVRGACATKDGMWGKVFLPYSKVADEFKRSGRSLDLRSEDFLETDLYIEVNREDVAEVCYMRCISDKGGKREPDMRTFYFSFYYCRETQTVHPYLTGSKVSIFWPEDQTWYPGTVTEAKNGLHCVVYDVDDSFEYVNLVSLKEEDALIVNS